MSESLEFESVDRVSVGTMGEPGQRYFLLQISQGDLLKSWLLEKEHVVALGTGSYALMAQIGLEEVTKEMLGKGMLGEPAEESGNVLVPDLPSYRIDGGSMVIGFNESKGMIEISFAELVPDADREASSARIWITREQFAALGVQALVVVAQGRPICYRCGGLLEEDEEHRCPPHVMNGHYPESR